MERLAEAEKRFGELTTPARLAHLIDPDDIARSWRDPARTIEAKRELLRMVLAPGLAGRLVIKRKGEGRSDGRKQVPINQRVVWLTE